MPDSIREAVNLPIGFESEFFVGSEADMGQDFHHSSVIAHNEPPSNQPGLWCNWISSEEGDFLEWDGGEKFYDYVEWLQYIIKHFLKRWGVTTNGCVRWRGEDFDDNGKITVINNTVTIQKTEI
ncbi:MAG: hypothetical protein ACRC2V_07745 [Xenococcaceae cyanobacterium]